MKIRIPIFNIFLQSETEFSWRDILAILGLIAILWLTVSLIRDITVPYTQVSFKEMDLSYSRIPYYMLRSTFRMFLAYGASLLFTMVFGYWAYRSKRARSLIIPAIDVLQSVPVLGFLSITVTGFMALFPGRLIGVELASLFAIFTGQAWNMVLSFYNSLSTLPSDLKEASSVFAMNPWQRFTKLELPNSTIGLVWNSMMSFGGGWFFVVQSEMITVLNKNIKLPGIGSYMGMAIDKGDSRAALYAVLAMITTIVLIDFLFWKPVTVWSLKFKNEQVESSLHPTSIVYDILSKSILVDRFFKFIINGIDSFFAWVFKIDLKNIFHISKRKQKKKKIGAIVWDVIFYGVVFLGLIYLITISFNEFKNKFSLSDLFLVFKLGSFTMMRVFLMVILSTLIWTPIGVWVGFNNKATQIVRPLAQIGASFPINMTFPVIVGFYLRHNINMDWGSILLLSLGAQWYVLFNIIAGASSIPSDMKESARIFKLKGINLWKKLIIPAIFPYWVTGACTAAGGAWNASIVAEYTTFGKDKLVAHGLGAYITDVSNKGDWNGIFLSIATMSLFVVFINRFVWRKLYQLSAERYHLD